jgi:hypothetical protein
MAFLSQAFKVVRPPMAPDYFPEAEEPVYYLHGRCCHIPSIVNIGVQQ